MKDLPIEEIYAMYKKGYNYTELAEKFNVYTIIIYNELQNYCKKNNLKLEKTFKRDLDVLGTNRYYKKERLKLPIEEIYDLYTNGYTVAEIAKKYKCSKSTISKRLHEYYLKLDNRFLRFNNEEHYKTKAKKYKL